MERLISSLRYFVLVLLTLHASSAQIAGPNVNMVSGKTLPGGDPYLQRQNEPSIAVSTRNPLHLLAGANDYRTVDIPFVPGTEGEDEPKGDAWLGVFKSFDGGLTWRSTLIPGYRQDTSPEGAVSPLKAAGFQAAADPVVREGTNGLFYYAGLAFNRGENAASAVFVTRFIDNNNKEAGDPFQQLGTIIVASSPGGAGTSFFDKPALAVDIPRSGALVCNIAGQSFAGGNVYLTYSAFQNAGTASETSQVMFSLSRDCGATWSVPISLTSSMTRDQGAVIAIDPVSGAVYVAWRRAPIGGGGSIFVAKSIDGGQTFSSATLVANFTPFDQGATLVSFRSVAYPAMAIDGSGRVYVAWSERGLGPLGEARVVVSTSADGVNWTPRSLVEPAETPVLPGLGQALGHQFMPSLVFAGGTLTLVYYDSREDETSGVLACSSGQTCSSTAQFVETRQPVGDLLPFPPTPAQLARVFNGSLADCVPDQLLKCISAPMQPLQRRHTLDVRVAQARPGSTPVFSSAQVSQYLFGSPSSSPGPKPINQLRFNPPNLPLFAGGLKAFVGDYLDVAASPAMVPQSAGTRTFWRFNVASSDSTAFHAAWTDNRDVVPPPPPDANWTNYTPPGSMSETPSTYLPGAMRPACIVRHEGMRDQNIYTSRITPGLFAGSPGNAKPLGTIQRGFVVFIQNARPVPATYRLTIPLSSQPAGGQASFQQFSLVTQIDVTVAPRSTASRTVFVTSANPRAQVTVDIVEIAGISGPPVPNGLQSTVLLNPDLTNPDLTNPDLTNPGLPDVRNSEVLNPDLTNPDLTNPDLTNPDLTNPDLTNPDLTNPDLTNPDLTNPGVPNPDLTNPDLTNPDLTNPDLTNPDLTNGSLTDGTWRVTNRGNSTAAYNAKLLLSGSVPPGFKTQMMIYRIYTTPAAKDCVLLDKSHNVLIANIPRPRFFAPSDPTVTSPDLTNPDLTNATFSLAPGEQARISLRVAGPSKSLVVDFINSVTLVVVPQEVNTADLQAGSQQPRAVASRLTLLDTPLPDAVAGTFYTFALRALTNVVGTPLTWSIIGGALPTGLTLNPATGVISGTTAASGVFTFTVRVTDPVNPALSDSRTFTLRVGQTLAITTGRLQDSVVGNTYTQTLTAIGGTGNLVWSLVPGSGSLPNGLILSSAGVLSGTLTTAGNFGFFVQVVDSGQPQQIAIKSFLIVVLPPLSPSLVFVVQPTDQLPGQPISPAVQVRAQDSTGAALPNINITVFLGANPGNATLSGAGATGPTGIATFSNLSISAVGNGYTLVAAAPNFSGATSDPFAVSSFLGRVTDPAGDATTFSGVNTPPDLVSASATVVGTNLKLSVRFAPGTFNSSTSLTQFVLDTDQNPSTGSPGSDSGGVNDRGIIGADYLVEMGSAFRGNQAAILQYAGTPNVFNTIGFVTVSFFPDGMDVMVPLSLLGNDDGNLNFKVITASQIGPNSFTGVADYMPNVGLPAGVVSMH